MREGRREIKQIEGERRRTENVDGLMKRGHDKRETDRKKERDGEI